MDKLERLVTDKGEWLSYTLNQQGESISTLIVEIIERAIKQIPIPKRMRWGNGTAEFVRPVKWLIVMHGETVLETDILGVSSGNVTRGHRFQGKEEIIIGKATDYEDALLSQGGVIACFKSRREEIEKQVDALAEQCDALVKSDPALLDEVTGLVEYPAALLGDFDVDFLGVPHECLISSMRDHQKYFHLYDKLGNLLPHFITISNINSSNPQRVKSGNECVLRARLSDARFFWNTDRKTPLESRLDSLDKVLFHQKLGSVLDKTKRVEQLTSSIAELIGADVSIAKRAATLCKADLVTDMVGEFDELQGVMGHYYADIDKEPKLVGECIEQHYWPKHSGAELPISKEAQAVALADKTDSLVGIFAAGEIPTGDKDPYALRRISLSILRIIIEKGLELDLAQLVTLSSQTFVNQKVIEIDAKAQESILEFVRGRLTAYYQQQGIDTTTINAVLASKTTKPLDFEHRLKAVNDFSNATEAQDLAAANKRISNILRKQNAKPNLSVNANLLVEPAEKSLYEAINILAVECNSLFDAGDYAKGLQLLASLRTPVDDFF